MKWDVEGVRAFFRTDGDRIENSADGSVIHEFRYAAKLLKYQMIVSEQYNHVNFSGDTTTPHGFDSLYEISIPCDHIKAGLMNTRKEGLIEEYLEFTYGQELGGTNITLVIIKRRDGDLIAWPNYRFPPEHHYGIKPEVRF